MTLEEKYNFLCNKNSDINEHLPTLVNYGNNKIVVELGVRTGVSTWAFLFSRPKKLISYDITRRYLKDEEGLLLKVAKDNNIDFKFIIGDSLKIDIPNCDVLFIDTLHCYNQLKLELERHYKNVNEYIIFHDTDTYGFKNEGVYNDASGIVKGMKIEKFGLIPAIDEFLNNHPKWKRFKVFNNNNGLTILKRG